MNPQAYWEAYWAAYWRAGLFALTYDVPFDEVWPQEESALLNRIELPPILYPKIF